MPGDPWYTTLAVPSKLVISGISGCSRGLLSMVFVSGRISMPCDPRYTTQAVPLKLMISGISGRFRGL